MSLCEFLTRNEAAEYLGVKPKTLDQWAYTQRYKIKYTKIGRLTKYRKEDLDSFIEERTVNKT